MHIVKTREGPVKVIPDGFWIIIFGMYGLVGLASITMAMLMPLLLLIRRFPASSWAIPEIAPVAVLTIILGLYMLDNLMNDHGQSAVHLDSRWCHRSSSRVAERANLPKQSYDQKLKQGQEET